MTKAEQTVRRLLASFEKDIQDLESEFHECLAHDVVWEQNPVPPSTSPAEAAQLMRGFVESTEYARSRIEIRTLLATDDVVMVERDDHLLRADGSTMVTVPVMGVFELNSRSQVAKWRDYFDPGPFLAMMPEESAGSHSA